MGHRLSRSLRVGMAFCAAIATAVIVGACGSGVPGNSVAVVGGRSITKAALTHWLNVANDATQASTGQKAPPLPVPPNYTACVAAERGNGTATSQTTAALKQTCAQNYKQLLSTVLNYLIQAVWVQGEAHDRGVTVSQKAVDKSY